MLIPGIAVGPDEIQTVLFVEGKKIVVDDKGLDVRMKLL